MESKKELILIVDDTPTNLQYLGNLLDEKGYDVGATASGLKALEFVNRKLPALILLDIMMPEMDGYEVCRRLKADLRTKHIPIIFLSAKTETDDIVKGFEVGGVDYVTKPFNAVELLARIATHIEVKILRGIIPICASCKKIRDDKGFWKQIETYISKHSDVMFSHSICQKCAKKLYPEYVDGMYKK